MTVSNSEKGLKTGSMAPVIDTVDIHGAKMRNVKFVSIATDRARPLQRLADKENYKFSIIADEQAKISKDYNVFGIPIDYDTIKSELAIPSTYLIDRNGKIVWRYIGTKTDRPKIQDILNAIDTYLQN